MASNDLTRVKGVTIVKPIIYGSISTYFGENQHDDGHTHEWTVYVRPYLNENINAWVKKVHFRLHESYENPTRVVENAPFEICESGWGEFEIIIKIFFQDTNERPITLHHILKLYSNGPDSEPSENPIVSELYEEIIFQDPSMYMKYILHDSLSNPPPVADQYLHYENVKKTTLDQILKARKKVQEHTALYKDRLKKLREAINKYNDEIYAMQSQCSSSTLR